jgi:glycosyltransferase involved in cell wall biosynthesis
MIITPSLECGGSEKFVSLICNHINTDKFSVCLAVVNNARPFYEINNAAIEIIDLKKGRVLFSLSAIVRVVKNFKPNIIFSTANHLNLYLAIFRNQFEAKIKFIAREASIVSINSKQAKMPALYSWLIKRYYNRFDFIICQSVYMQQDLTSNYQMPVNKTMVIYNATEQLAGNSIQPKIKEGETIYKFITVARLSEEKGIKRLIHAVGLLTEPFVYYIIGEGNLRNELQKLIYDLELQDKVFFTGQKNDPFDGMENADLFLMGSYYEGFPNVLLEAGSRGIPVIVFNVPGGIAEIIIPGENGILVEDKDINGFATAVKNALQTNFDRDRIIDTTKKRFSVNNMLHAVENIFLKLAQNK